MLQNTEEDNCMSQDFNYLRKREINPPLDTRVNIVGCVSFCIRLLVKSGRYCMA